MSAPEPLPDVVRIDALANGGEGVGRLADGRACFVAGALPGELVAVRVQQTKARWARASLEAVVEAAPGRVTPPCAWQRAGCGGCDLMHAEVALQRAWRVRLAGESLQRLGRLADAVVVAGPGLASERVRTTVRLAVEGGRAALRRRASHQLQPIDSCLVLHPGLDELLATARFAPHVAEVTLRIGAATGQRLAVLSPRAGRGAAVLPPDVTVVGADALGAADVPAYHEVVAARRWRISAGSFFQTSAVGAAALVDAVRRAAHRGGPVGAGVRVLDAYCGVGLLSAAVAADEGGAAVGASLVAVESNPSSVADAGVNLADLDARVVRCRVERWRAEPVDLAVADPARRGLGAEGASVLAATGAAVIVLVSCDLASLGRDAGDLDRLGYQHVRSEVLDLFPHTSHAEVVTRFERR